MKSVSKVKFVGEGQLSDEQFNAAVKEALATSGVDNLGAIQQRLMSLTTSRSMTEQLSQLISSVTLMQGSLKTLQDGQKTLQDGQEKMQEELRQIRPSILENSSSEMEETARKRPRIDDHLPGIVEDD